MDPGKQGEMVFGQYAPVLTRLFRLCPFIFDAWNSPEVLNAVSRVAGVDLVPAIEYEVGHVNISINDVTTELTAIENSDDSSAFAWHLDSYAFVCVTMLSDCTGMIGGETAMRTGTGEVMKVRGPAMVGCCPSQSTHAGL